MPINERSKGNITHYIFLAGLSLLVLFRLLVWKLFVNLDVFVKEDLSNLLCLVPILVFAGVFYGRKAVLGLPLQERRTGLEPVLWALLAACALSLLPSVDRTATLRYVMVWFSYVLFFFMLAETLDTAARRKWFLVFLVGLALLIAGWGIRDYLYLIGRAPDPSDEGLANTNDSLYYILTHKRACSFFGWPNVLAGFLGLTIPLAFTVALTWRAWWAKLAAGISVLVLAVTLLLTFSFLGWLSLLIGFIVTIAVLFLRRQLIGRGVKIALICFAVLAAGLFTFVILKKNFSISVTPRQQYFNQAVRGIARHPVLGTGLDTFRYASAKEAVDKGGLTAFAHNSYLQLWVEAGLLGFLAGLGLAFFILWKFFRLVWLGSGSAEDRLRNAAFAWAFTSFLVDNIWSFTLIKPNISLFFWVVLAYACSFDTREVRRKEVPRPLRATAGWAAVAAIITVLFFTGRALAAQWMCKIAFEAEAKGRPQEALAAFQRARLIYPEDARIAFETGKRYIQSYHMSGDSRMITLAEQEFLVAVDNAPTYGPRLMMGLICQSQGRMRDSRDWLSEAYTLSPFETQRDLKAIGIAR